MKRLMMLGLLTMLALGVAACGEETGSEEQPAPANTEEIVVEPDYPIVRLAGRPGVEGDLVIAAQWLSARGEWQRRIVLGRVSGEQLNAGGCFVTEGRPIGKKEVLIRGHACTPVSGGVDLYISGQRQYQDWSDERFLGHILSEQRELVGTWVHIGTDLRLSTSAIAPAKTPNRTSPSRSTRTTLTRNDALCERATEQFAESVLLATAAATAQRDGELYEGEARELYRLSGNAARRAEDDWERGNCD